MKPLENTPASSALAHQLLFDLDRRCSELVSVESPEVALPALLYALNMLREKTLAHLRAWDVPIPDQRAHDGRLRLWASGAGVTRDQKLQRAVDLLWAEIETLDRRAKIANAELVRFANLGFHNIGHQEAYAAVFVQMRDALALVLGKLSEREQEICELRIELERRGK